MRNSDVKKLKNKNFDSKLSRNSQFLNKSTAKSSGSDADSLNEYSQQEESLTTSFLEFFSLFLEKMKKL